MPAAEDGVGGLSRRRQEVLQRGQGRLPAAPRHFQLQVSAKFRVWGSGHAWPAWQHTRCGQRGGGGGGCRAT